MNFPEIFSMVKDLALAGAAFTTAYVALAGLEKWQKELTGKANFDVARELAKSIYLLRDAISSCRSPFTAAHEFPEGYDGVLSKRSNEEEGQAWAFVYKKRWEPVGKALQSLDTATLEAEALWGKEIKEKVQELRLCTTSLFVDIQTFIEDKYSGGEDFKDQEFARAIHFGIWDKKPSENELTLRINKAIDGIESVIRPHLSRN